MKDKINWLTEEEKETEYILRQAERHIKGLCPVCGASLQVYGEMLGPEHLHFDESGEVK